MEDISFDVTIDENGYVTEKLKNKVDLCHKQIEIMCLCA